MPRRLALLLKREDNEWVRLVCPATIKALGPRQPGLAGFGLRENRCLVTTKTIQSLQSHARQAHGLYYVDTDTFIDAAAAPVSAAENADAIAAVEKTGAKFKGIWPCARVFIGLSQRLHTSSESDQQTMPGAIETEANEAGGCSDTESEIPGEGHGVKE